MQNFSFYNPTKILFGQGQIAALSEELPAGAKVLLTYGGGSIHRNGVYTEVTAALSGHAVVEFGGIEANPRFETLMRAVELARAERVDFILAVGGGSVIDGSKFIAAAFYHQGDAWAILADHAPVRQALPLGTVLTLPATGSEMNAFAVITRASTHEKLPFSSPLVYPRFSVLDPSKTFTLPPRQIANGVVDAFTHTVEQYLTYPVNAPLQDRFAEGILQTLIEEGPKTLRDPQDYDARANMMWCATMALNGLIAAGVPQDWATHMIGHEITALHGLDHAQTLAVVLPATLQRQRDGKRDKLIQYGRRVWGLSGEDDRIIDEAIAHTRSFFESLGVKTHLRDYGIGADAIPALVSQLEKHGMVQLGERGDITPQRSREILELCA
ncbi:MAG: iron-containing alcohol dehydrogenase [Acidithiobacillus sp.]